MTRLKEGLLYNEDDSIYIKGDSDTVGSKKIIIDTDTGNAVIMRMVAEDVWQSDSFEFGPNTVWVGLSVGLAGIGHHLATESRLDNHFHFFAHSGYDGEVSTIDTKMLKAVSYTAAASYQPDFSGEWTGTTLDFTMASPSHILVSAIQYKTGSISATKPIRIQIYEGTDGSDITKRIFSQEYPASLFLANSDVTAPYAGRVEFYNGVTYYVKYTSDEDFSLKTNAAVTMPYFTGDTSYLREDDMLQIRSYESRNDGDYSFTSGEDWTIQSNKIYICNTTGTQTGTFASNSAKWDSVGISHDDYWTKTDAVLQNASGVDSFIFNDGAWNRIWVTNGQTELRSSNGLSTSSLYDAQYQLTIAGGTKLDARTDLTQLTGPGGRNLLMDTSSIGLNDGTNDRITIDSANSYLYSPDKSNYLDAQDAHIRLYGESSYVELKPTEFTFYDGSRSRLNINSSTFIMRNEDESMHVNLDTTLGFQVANGSKERFQILDDLILFSDNHSSNFERLRIDNTRSRLISDTGASGSYLDLVNDTATINDGTYDRLTIDTTQTRITSELGTTGSYIKLDTDEITLHDATKARIFLSDDYTVIHDEPIQGGGYLTLQNKGLSFVDGTIARFYIDASNAVLQAPDGGNNINVTDDNIVLSDGTVTRLETNGSTKIYGTTTQIRFEAGGAGGGGPTKIWSEDGQYGIRIDSTGIDFTRNGGASWDNQYN